MRGRREVVTEIAQGVFDGAEALVVRQIDEFVGQTLDEGVGRAAQGLHELLTSCVTPFRDRFSGRSRWRQHGNRPGVTSRKPVAGASISAPPNHHTRATQILHLLS